MKYSKLMLGIAFLSCLCLAGCSDGSSGGNKGVLDLRIQNNGTIATSSKFIENEAGSSASYEAEIKLENVVAVKAVAEEDGMHFTITNPANIPSADSKYKKGCNFIAVYRIEKINGEDFQTTCAVIDHSPFDSENEGNPAEKIEFVYPLCEAEEVYKFKIQIEPKREKDEEGNDLQVDRKDSYWHYLTVKAKGGIGDIDYSNLKNGEWAFASHSDGKANVWIKNVIPPQDSVVKVVKNVGTYIDIFYGDKDWGKNTDWFTNYESKGNVKESCSIELKFSNVGQGLEYFGAKTFFAQYSFTFKVPACPQVRQWRTATLDTNLVEVD